jgi:hypothetical protein
MSASEQGLQALQLYNIKFGRVTFLLHKQIFKNFHSHVTVPYFSGLEISGAERYWKLPQFLR